MRIAPRAMIVLGLLIGSSTCAMAGDFDITWALNDVHFSDGNVATGFFVTNSSVTSIVSYSIVVSGPDTAADFTANVMVDAYLPTTIGAAFNPGFPPIWPYI